MNRTQLEHIIRAASQIADDAEIVVVGSQAIHAQNVKLPAIAFLSAEADVYPRNRPEPTISTRPSASCRHSTRPMAITPMAFHPIPPFFPRVGSNA